MKERLYKVGEVAQIFGVTNYTVREWLNRENGGMKGTKTESGTWRIPESEVSRWANLKHGAQS